MLKPGLFKHFNCRNAVYPKSGGVQRFPVPDDCVSWEMKYAGYQPIEYTAPQVSGQSWADPADMNAKLVKWNQLDGNVNRVSFNGVYDVVNGRPRNAFGRTGIVGRGLLGRWGPNHAADPIVTRWKRDIAGCVLMQGDKPVLQMVSIQRHDNRMWAIPGGMVDAGEKVSATLKREFMEEALDSVEQRQMIEDFFACGVEVYAGYVDDYRNTDNAWMETVAYHFHDDNGSRVGKLQLSAGDDAANVKWLDVHAGLRLHANHIDMLAQVTERLAAYWN